MNHFNKNCDAGNFVTFLRYAKINILLPFSVSFLFSIRTYQTRNARDIRYFNRNHKFFTTNITLNCYVATRIKYITYLRLGLNHPNISTHQLSRYTYSFLGLRFWNINISTLFTPLSFLSKGKNCGNLEWGNSYFIRLFD